MGTEQRMSQQKQKNPKDVWTLEYHKTFVELCYEEMLKGNKPGTSFNKIGWNNLVSNFEKEKLGKHIL